MRDHRVAPTIIILAGLLVAATFFRLPNLGASGFYGDEETTSYVARSVAEGEGFRMPSGLPYYRAAPLTLLNALSAKSIGIEKEYGYRLPSAILGLVTPVVFFLLARMLVPTGVALAAAVLLVLSEWHIITSREARMYAPFMLCFMVTGFMVWRWARSTNSWKIAAIFAGIAVTTTLNGLGLLLLLFPVVWLCLQTDERPPWKPMAAITAVAPAFFFLVSRPLVSGTFEAFRRASGIEAEGLAINGSPDSIAQWAQVAPQAFPWLLGGILGAWVGWRMIRYDKGITVSINQIAVLGACTIAGAALAALQIYGAMLAATCALLLHPGKAKQAIGAGYLPIVMLTVVAIVHFLSLYGSSFPIWELKKHFLFPYPYFFYFWEYSPGLLLLFWVGVVFLIFDDSGKDIENLKAAALITICIIAGVGVAMKWGGMRYLIGAYPTMLLVACYPLYKLLRINVREHSGVHVVVSLGVLLLILGGALGGHGIVSALHARDISYGPGKSTLSFGFPVYPDHKGAGEYVRDNIGVEDTVVAEDVLQQHWYTGRTDYWLSNAKENAQFTYRDKHGILRDIYVNSRLLVAPGDANLCSNKRSSIWVITSGEMSHRQGRHLSEVQRIWLARIEIQYDPVFKGRDGYTKVYKVSCR